MVCGIFEQNNEQKSGSMSSWVHFLFEIRNSKIKKKEKKKWNTKIEAVPVSFDTNYYSLFFFCRIISHSCACDIRRPLSHIISNTLSKCLNECNRNNQTSNNNTRENKVKRKKQNKKFKNERKHLKKVRSVRKGLDDNNNKNKITQIKRINAYMIFIPSVIQNKTKKKSKKSDVERKRNKNTKIYRK